MDAKYAPTFLVTMMATLIAKAFTRDFTTMRVLTELHDGRVIGPVLGTQLELASEFGLALGLCAALGFAAEVTL
ncbi:hypothetical protein B7R54_19070 [Subtercola boreus]|uniref:Uncharacterized protein n=1 Tax=Subtercola boreus TaxID=120213 RepID=A0A3E0VC64_9MICO|nr:hypothetical protein [Subtercola boreus]RFA06477.1 hypothetical protein B7R54_19070 [Subtercola boreus]TQL46926.1 hypothetical protein FB464_3921 [Subtercola boreus]